MLTNQNACLHHSQWLFFPFIRSNEVEIN
jgi:hypothetical protein